MTVLLLLMRPTPRAGSAIAVILGPMWLWTGLAYYAAHFSAINRAAYDFAVLFVVQACCWRGRAPPGIWSFGSEEAPAAASAPA